MMVDVLSESILGSRLHADCTPISAEDVSNFLGLINLFSLPKFSSAYNTNNKTEKLYEIFIFIYNINIVNWFRF